jgi:AhpD family alkylhydroperoxidase
LANGANSPQHIRISEWIPPSARRWASENPVLPGWNSALCPDSITILHAKEEIDMFLLDEVEKLYERFANAVYKPNVLDGKTKELIALSDSVMADCVPCINYHYSKAVEYGASKEEIAEALAIAMSVSAGSKQAKYSPVIEKLEKADLSKRE